jgi:hypothetical protein
MGACRLANALAPTVPTRPALLVQLAGGFTSAAPQRICIMMAATTVVDVRPGDGDALARLFTSGNAALDRGKAEVRALPCEAGSG